MCMYGSIIPKYMKQNNGQLEAKKQGRKKFIDNDTQKKETSFLQIKNSMHKISLTLIRKTNKLLVETQIKNNTGAEGQQIQI